MGWCYLPNCDHQPCPKQCEACQGQGQIPIGERFVSRDMALDAGEPAMEGMSCGIEWGQCEECYGTGYLEKEENL